MLSVSITPINFDVMAKKLIGSKSSFDIASKAMMDSATLIGQEKAKSLSPVRTGFLRDSIQRRWDARQGTIGTSVSYAPFQEFGTSRGVPARHFLKGGSKAIKQNIKKIQDIGIRTLKRELGIN